MGAVSSLMASAFNTMTSCSDFITVQNMKHTCIQYRHTNTYTQTCIHIQICRHTEKTNVCSLIACWKMDVSDHFAIFPTGPHSKTIISSLQAFLPSFPLICSLTLLNRVHKLDHPDQYFCCCFGLYRTSFQLDSSFG